MTKNEEAGGPIGSKALSTQSVPSESLTSSGGSIAENAEAVNKDGDCKTENSAFTLVR